MSLSQDEQLVDQILQTAQELYQRYGTKKVTMDDVAKAIGKTRTALYYYFKNRDELFEAVMLSLVQEVKAELAHVMEQEKDLEARIFAFCIAKIKGSEKSKSFIAAIESGMDLEERSKYTSIMWGVHQKMMEAEHVLLKKVMEQAIDQKEIPAQDSAQLEVVILVLLSGIRGIRRETAIDVYAGQWKKAAAVLSSLIVKELKG